MKNISEILNKYLNNLLNDLEEKNDEVILFNLGKELKYNVLFRIIIEKLFITALEQGKIINSFFAIKSIPRDHLRRIYSDSYIPAPSGNSGKEIEVFPGVVFSNGTLLKVLEKMKLVKTKEFYIKMLIIEEEELNENLFYTQEEINEFNSDDFESILKEELEEKYGNEKIILSL